MIMQVEHIEPQPVRLADVGEKARLQIDPILKSARVEQPHEQDVLRVVPDVNREPAVGDVLNHEIAGGEDSKVAHHVERMHCSEPLKPPSLDAAQCPVCEQNRRQSGRYCHKPRRQSE